MSGLPDYHRLVSRRLSGVRIYSRLTFWLTSGVGIYCRLKYEYCRLDLKRTGDFRANTADLLNQGSADCAD